MRNLITDVEGVLVGNAEDQRVASGVSVVLFEQPAVASIAIHGGAPGLRDGALLEPEMTVSSVDAIVLSGGSAFGLDAPGGVQAHLLELGRGLAVGPARVPIVPGAILFDLANGGNKDWGHRPPYWDLGYQAARSAGATFTLGTAGVGYGLTTYDLKGGLGSASAVTSNGFGVGALVGVNAVGRATRGKGPHFWAAPYEHEAEFGGLGQGGEPTREDLQMRIKGNAPANSTIGVVVTDAALTKAQMKRVAIMAQDGFALSLRPAHAPMDGDIVFAATTGRAARTADLTDLTEIGMMAAECLARAIARGIYEATPLSNGVAPPSWREVHAASGHRKRPTIEP